MSGAGARSRGRLRSDWRVVDGCRWHARVSVDPAPAEGPPVVLVHGLGVSSRYMVPTARCLAPFVPTYAPDLPGFGRSRGPDRALDVAGLADALVGWLEGMGLDRALLLGNSLGCQIVVDVAVRYPERVGWIVLAGPTGDPAARSLAHYAWRLLLDVPREPVRLVLIQAGDYLRAGPRRTFQSARAMVGDPFAAKLPLVRQPALVVRGEHDPIAPQRWAEEATRLLPRGRLVVVPDAAHVVNYDAPGALVAATRALLDAEPAIGPAVR